jgi:hypothetical protein
MPAHSTCSITGCGRPSKTRGWCQAHYMRWWYTGDTQDDVPLTIYGNHPARFWSKVTFTESCWLWTSSIDRGGYGQFDLGNKSTIAHRWAYEFCVGDIPEGLDLDHLCRVRHCVNPDHLEPVTRSENMRRSPIAISGINARKTHCKRGHEFTPENTYRDSRGRKCRECVLAASRRQRARGRIG